MIVSHRHGFIFFHNPKCAGTSFRETLAPYHDDPFTFWGIYNAPYFHNMIDHTHLRLWEMQAQFPALFDKTANYNSIIFVRSPYARFLSAMNEHLKKFQPQIDVAGMSPDQRRGLVEEFIAKVLHVSRIITDWRFIHFSPQNWYLTFGGRTVPRHVIPMIEGGDGFAQAGLDALGLPDLAVPRHNPSPVDLSAALSSKPVRDHIETFYAEDFAFFRADPALAPLAVPPP
jgi:hypothetical protein